MEQNLQQLQLNLASSHQRHKTEIQRLDEQVRSLETDLGDTRKHNSSMETEAGRKEEVIRRQELDIKSARDDINAKVDEVSLCAYIYL